MSNKKADEAILLMEERVTNMQKMCIEHNITFACAFMARAEWQPMEETRWKTTHCNMYHHDSAAFKEVVNHELFS